MAQDKMNVGLDIGANSIKAIYLAPTKTGYSIVAVKECRLKSSSTENGFVSDFGELVVGIKSIMESDFPTNNIATALKGESTFARKLSVYCENPNELYETFPWIIDQYVAIDPEEMSLDFEILGEGERYHHVKILVVGAKKDTITDIVSVIESSEAVPKIIEPETLSLARLFRAVSKVHNDTVMIIHIGYVGSLVIFLHNGTYDFSHEIDIGGMYCLNQLINELGLSREEAESAMINPESSQNSGKVKKAILDKFSKPFAEDIKKTLKLYDFKGGNNPYKVMLSGGACQTFGIIEVLNDELSIPVEYLDPWSVVEIPAELKKAIKPTNKYTYNVAVGLAMSGKVY